MVLGRIGEAVRVCCAEIRFQRFGLRVGRPVAGGHALRQLPDPGRQRRRQLEVGWVGSDGRPQVLLLGVGGNPGGIRVFRHDVRDVVRAAKREVVPAYAPMLQVRRHGHYPEGQEVITLQREQPDLIVAYPVGGLPNPKQRPTAAPLEGQQEKLACAVCVPAPDGIRDVLPAGDGDHYRVQLPPSSILIDVSHGGPNVGSVRGAFNAKNRYRKKLTCLPNLPS